MLPITIHLALLPALLIARHQLFYNLYLLKSLLIILGTLTYCSCIEVIKVYLDVVIYFIMLALVVRVLLVCFLPVPVAVRIVDVFVIFFTGQTH